MNEGLVSILLLQYETKALAAGVRAEACWFVEVEEVEGRVSSEDLFGCGEGMV